ncbi:hypothetical protein [Pseudomonas fluorescens]|uniref:hypothetical protein n=1 Tax=Pseudomonas fluorescens TaxID=294 RepID=UPI00123F2C3D|nr:hypothetical protein [Pseudomonas fluorescens]
MKEDFVFEGVQSVGLDFVQWQFEIWIPGVCKGERQIPRDDRFAECRIVGIIYVPGRDKQAEDLVVPHNGARVPPNRDAQLRHTSVFDDGPIQQVVARIDDVRKDRHRQVIRCLCRTRQIALDAYFTIRIPGGF